MKKAELLDWLQEEYQKWEAFIDQVGPAGMDQPGVNGDWSIKDIVAHLMGWNRYLGWPTLGSTQLRSKTPERWPGWACLS